MSRKRPAPCRGLGLRGVCRGLQQRRFDDLFCTGFGQDILYRNNGTEPSKDVTRRGAPERGAAMGSRMQLLD